jgi:hypothetical protein
MIWIEFRYILFLLFAPFSWGTKGREETTPKASDGFSEGTQVNLRRDFRRFLGRRRKSRWREAAGRGNCPEAVPKEKRGEKGKCIEPKQRLDGKPSCDAREKMEAMKAFLSIARRG